MENSNYVGETIGQFFNNRETGNFNQEVSDRFEDLLTKHISPAQDVLITNSIRTNSFANNGAIADQEVLKFNQTLMNYRTEEQRSALFEARGQSGLMFAAGHLPKNQISEYFELRSTSARDEGGSNELHYCAIMGQTDAMEFLSKQADKHEYFIENNRGSTPIDFSLNGQEKAPERISFIVNHFVDETNPKHITILNKAKGKAVVDNNAVLAQVLTIGQPVPEYKVAPKNIEPAQAQEKGIISSLKSKIESIREAAGFGPASPSLPSNPSLNTPSPPK